MVLKLKSSPGFKTALPLLTLLLLCLALYLGPALTLPLIRPEAMFALVPREMLASGQWISATLNGVPYWDKPPLLYWLNLLAFKVFGVSDWAARVPTLGLTLSEVGATFLVGGLLLGRRAAWLGSFILLTSLGFFVLHLQIFTDHLITVTLTVSLYALLRWMERPRLTWVFLFHLAMAVGFLSKGLIGLGFPLLIGLLYAWQLRQPRLLAFLFHPGGLTLVALLIIPWLVVMERHYPGFCRYHLVHEHLVRFLGQRQPNGVSTISFPMFWLFLGIWLMPWVLLLPQALYRYFKNTDPVKSEGAGRLLIIWAAVVLGVFTLSSTRIEYYSLPALPPLALILGWRLDEYLKTPDGSVPGALLLIGLTGVGTVWWLGGLEYLCDANRREFFGMFPLIKPLAPLAIFSIPALTIGGALWGWRRPRFAASCYGALALVLILLTFVTWWVLSPLLSDKSLGNYVSLHAQPGDLVVMESIEEFEYGASLAFYAGRRILMVQRQGLPHFNYPVAPEKNFLISPDRLRKLWYGPQRLFLLVDNAMPLEPYLKETRVVQEGVGKCLLSNRTGVEAQEGSAVPGHGRPSTLSRGMGGVNFQGGEVIKRGRSLILKPQPFRHQVKRP
jgi:hypothetical protein